MLTYILLVLGFVILIKGADLLVHGSASIAKRFGISSIVIGLTVVAFGTSAPELFVNLSAALNGNTDIAIGNIVGSNIVNILIILGVSAIIFPLTVTRGTVWKEIPLSLLGVLLVFVMANDTLIDKQSFNALTRSDGLALIAFFIIFLYYIVSIAKAQKEENPDELQQLPFWKSSVMIVLGLAGLVFGGKWIVEGAIAIAQQFQLSEALIGLTIVAIGTSLPELATSVVAAYRKQSDIAIGNVVGSNIFNVFWILGISSIIRPLPFNTNINFDLYAVISASTLLFLWMFIGKRHELSRWQGAIFVLLYVAYIAFIIARG